MAAALEGGRYNYFLRQSVKDTPTFTLTKCVIKVEYVQAYLGK